MVTAIVTQTQLKRPAIGGRGRRSVTEHAAHQKRIKLERGLRAYADAEDEKIITDFKEKEKEETESGKVKETQNEDS